jgi:hypothetical protein
MRPILLLLTASIYLSSCASLNQQKYTGFNVRTNPDNYIIYDCEQYEFLGIDGDTIVNTSSCGTYKMKGYDSKAYLVRTRSKEPTPVTVTNNTKSRTVHVRPGLFGTYHRKVYVDLRDTGNYYTFYKQPRKGNFQLLLSPAIGNAWLFSFGEEIVGAVPLMGTHIGAGYWYDRNNFVSLTFGTAGSVKPYCYDKCIYSDTIPSNGRRQSAWFFSLKNHHVLGRFDIGYGLYAGRHKWELFDKYESRDVTIKKRNMASFGPTVSTHFQIFTFLYGGFEYQPQFFTIDKTTPKGYQHILNIGVQFRLTPKRHSI